MKQKVLDLLEVAAADTFVGHDVYSKGEVAKLLNNLRKEIEKLEDKTPNIKYLRECVHGAIFQCLPNIQWSTMVDVEVDLSLDGNEIETDERIDVKVEELYNEIVDAIDEDVFSEYKEYQDGKA